MPLVHVGFMANILGSLGKKEVSETVLPISFPGGAEARVTVKVTNQRGQLSNPRNFPQLEKEMRDEMIAQGGREQRDVFGYLATRREL